MSPALIVVHGIGRQQRGDTLHPCVGGLLAVCKGAQLRDEAGQAIAVDHILTSRLDRVTPHQGGLALRLFEVHWADLLPADLVHDRFDKFALDEVTWFGWLNGRAGLQPVDDYPRALVLLRTLQLWGLQVAGSLARELLVGIRKLRSTLHDQTAADVWHHVHSLAGDLAPGSPLQGRSEQVLDRLRTTWQVAAAGGSPVHLMGHSLGSVIAYHGPGQTLRFFNMNASLHST